MMNGSETPGCGDDWNLLLESYLIVDGMYADSGDCKAMDESDEKHRIARLQHQQFRAEVTAYQQLPLVPSPPESRFAQTQAAAPVDVRCAR